ncbi:MAG: hypothetical protein EOO89_22370, partial [Pedobacter sp.]
MKKLLFTGFALFSLTISVFAQKKSGAIQFETTLDPAAMAAASGIRIPEQMLAQMPKAVKTNSELLFNATNASYMPVEETEDSNGGGGGMNIGRMMTRFGGGMGGNREYYYTFADQKLHEVFDLSDTTYAMVGKLKVASNLPQMPAGGAVTFGGPNANNNNNANTQNTSAVQFTNDPPVMDVIKTDETKMILGLNCKKVIVRQTRKAKVLGMDKDVTDETAVWYTNDLGFNFSPDTNLWTEGTVLAIESKGKTTIAKSIEYRNVSAKDVTAPKKAVSITAEEYAVKQQNMMNRFRGG